MSHFLSKTVFSHLRSSGFSHLRSPPISVGRIGVRAAYGGDCLDHFEDPNEQQQKQAKKRGLDQYESPNKQQKMMPRSGLSTWRRMPRKTTEGEGEAEYRLRFDMPGMTKEDVKVWVEEKKMLDVKAPEDGAEDWPARSHISIALPEKVEFEKIKAEVTDGVLYVTIPKATTTANY